MLHDPEAVKRDAAIQSAVSHANVETPQWSTIAMAFLIRHCDRARGDATMQLFTCELLRKLAEVAGVPPPPDSRAWGGVIRAASKAQLIRMSGYTKNVGRHKGDAKVWMPN
jgi:hypothetical protein